MPELSAGEVLIEVDAAPANPSDLAFIQGGYNIRKPLPAIPGFEGCGRVVQAGSDAPAASLEGRRVSFFSQSGRGGSWSTHIPVKAHDCIAIDDSMPDEQAACFSVNPFTAYAMVDLARRSGSRAIIQNAAAGQAGRFVNILANRENIGIINIVRKEGQVEQLRSSGFEHVLCSQDEDFAEKLKHAATALQANIAFDAVGGDLSGQMLASMPQGSSLYVYGGLGGGAISGIPATDVIFLGKSIRGFNMNEWRSDLSQAEFKDISNRLQQLFLDGTLKTMIQARFPLAEFAKALMQYIRNMSDGKVLLIPKE
jgi:NADPH:quinone reductase-like Zn-dependent oxidoreductase